MWEVKNRTPFKAAGAFERDVNGHESWCVAVRATFDFSDPSALTILPDQPDVRQAPNYADDANTELLAEQDCVAFATGSDVLLHGTVRPAKQNLKQLPLRLRLGKIDKSARLLGPRIAKRGIFGWRIEDQRPVQDTVLSWHNGAGGTLNGNDAMWHPANPLGMGVELLSGAKTARGATVGLPFFEAANDDFMDDPDASHPIGFGAISRNWTPRLGFAGTFDTAWETERAPLLPTDFDPRFYNTAPIDQQVTGFLKGGEPVTLDGFMPGSAISFRLPQILLTAQTLIQRRPIETRFDVLRVELDIDTRQLAMVWVTRVPCNGNDASIHSTIVRVKQMSGVSS